jgi:hypothetical protein
MDRHGTHGIPELCGTKPNRLTTEQIRSLKTGDKVIVTWDGGNGPHLYEIRNDLDDWTLYRTAGATSTADLLEYKSPHYVSLPDTKPTPETDAFMAKIDGDEID